MTAKAVAKKISGREPQGVWRQEEPIGSKLPNSDSDMFIAVTMKRIVFCVVMLWSWERDRRIRGAYCLHLQG
jgi:hypothetical protein